MNPNVSIIIPVYNTSKYLDRCMNSVLRQTLTNIEIILVDDGSTDNSGELCDTYLDKDERVVVLHKENGGLTSAWKAGAEVSIGEFIGFVDSDDWILADMYETMYQAAIKEKAEIVCCGIKHVFEKEVRAPWDDEMNLPKDTYTKEEMAQEIFPGLINNGHFMGRGLQPNRVSKIVKRKLVISNMEFCDNRVSVGEDYQFSLAVFLDASKIHVLKNYLPYYYWMNTGSMTGGFDFAYMDKIARMRDRLLLISKTKNVYNFSSQIWNDFLCLTVLNVKGEVAKNTELSYTEHRRNMNDICTLPDVRMALSICCMDKLTMAERMFLFFMKHKWYLAIYMAVRIYFRT